MKSIIPAIFFSLQAKSFSNNNIVSLMIQRVKPALKTSAFHKVVLVLLEVPFPIQFPANLGVQQMMEGPSNLVLTRHLKGLGEISGS